MDPQVPPTPLPSTEPKKKYILLKILFLLSLLGGIIFYIFPLFISSYFLSELASNPAREKADLRGGREANYWELNYAKMASYTSYPNLCDKIYPEAYQVIGGGFTGQPLGIKNVKAECLSNLGKRLEDYHEGDYVSMGTSPLTYMGYSEEDIDGRETDFLYERANTDEFRARLSKLPDFQTVKNDTDLLASSLMCGVYRTSYRTGMSGYRVSEYEAARRPCCLDLNQDKICDGIQYSDKSLEAGKVDITLTLSGPGFIEDRHENPSYPEVPYAGYLIKGTPFAVQITLSNNNVAAIDSIDAYVSLGARDIYGGLGGLSELSKYRIIPIPRLEAGQSINIPITGLMYDGVIEGEQSSDITISAAVEVQGDLVSGAKTRRAGIKVFGFATLENMNAFKKSGFFR